MPREPAPLSERELRFEIVAVLAMAFLPSLLGAFQPRPEPSDGFGAPSTTIPLWFHMLHLAVAGLAVILPLAALLWARRERWSRFGIVPFRPLPDLGGSAALLALAAAIWWLLGLFLWPIFARATGADTSDATWFAAPSKTPLDLVLVVLGSVINAGREEFAMRGYLIPRLEQAGLPTGSAVVLSSLLFASYHLYQGTYAFVVILATGLLFGFAFARFRRLWPLVIAHAVWDIVLLGGLL